MKKNLIILYVILVAVTSCKKSNDVIPEAEILAIESGLLPAAIVKGNEPMKYNILDRMAHYNVPGVSIAIVKDGKLHWAKGYGIANTDTGTPVTTTTLFQAGSISKPVAALAALKLSEEGKVNLDEDVNVYLKGWKIPENKYTETEKVTLRRLMTHTAGMTVHGFPGYTSKDTIPSIEDVLNGKGNTPKITLDTFPESIWRYSGGGYTVMEKVVEDLTGVPFEKYMEDQILQPLQMNNSTYVQPIPVNFHGLASAAYDREGTIIEGLWHNYPEQAAAGLWTTPSELAVYCIAIQNIFSGKSGGILSESTVKAMLTKHKNEWGLGPSLKWEADSLIFQHGGKNAGFTNNMISFAKRGDAVIVMTNADNGGHLIGEILRSVSAFYTWNIAEQKEVESVSIDEERLQQMPGKYKLNRKIPGISDYFVEALLDHNQLVVIDTNSNDRHILTPIDSLKFIDLIINEEVEFQLNEYDEISGFLWNTWYQFDKVKK